MRSIFYGGPADGEDCFMDDPPKAFLTFIGSNPYQIKTHDDCYLLERIECNGPTETAFYVWEQIAGKGREP